MEKQKGAAEYSFLWFAEGVSAQILDIKEETTKEGAFYIFYLRPTDDLIIRYNINSKELDGHGALIKRFPKAMCYILNPSPVSGRTWCWLDWEGKPTEFYLKYGAQYLSIIQMQEKEIQRLRANIAVLQEEIRNITIQQRLWAKETSELKEELKGKERPRDEMPIDLPRREDME